MQVYQLGHGNDTKSMKVGKQCDNKKSRKLTIDTTYS